MIFRIRFALLVLSLALLQPALSFAEEDDFLPAHWSEGLHLFAGGGINSSRFDSESRAANIGLGSNFKTELGYFFTDRLAFEAGASVKFNRSSETLIWDTMFTLGTRFQFPDWAKFSYRLGEPYMRVFWGRAPTVIYINNVKNVGPAEDRVDRIQFDGQVWGLAIGSFYKTVAGHILYSEIAATRHHLANATGIHQDDSPVFVYQVNTPDRPVIFTLYLTLGFMAF